MSDPELPRPKVSNRLSPIAIIVIVALIGMVLIAVLRTQGHHHTPTGVNVPLAQSSANVTMPQQPTVANHPQPMANTNDAVEAQPTGNEPGGPEAHSGPVKNSGG